jgi:hypothetical protein
MFFAMLPDARHSTTLEFMRHRVGALRRAAPGQPAVRIQRPSVSRYLIAAICGLLLWQPLSSRGADEHEAPAEPAAWVQSAQVMENVR